mgnify:FL=1
MLYLFLIIIVLGLLAAMLTAFAKLIRDLGELAAMMRASGSGTENNAGKENSPADNSGGVANDHPYTQDDIIYKNGRYYENENSEDWEEFEYEISEDERFK